MTLAATGLTVSATIGGRRVDVLRDIDFAVGAGKVLGLVGESGAGKSMIGRILSQTLPEGFTVSAGALSFGGVDLVQQSPAQLRSLLGDRITFIPQEPLSALNPLQTIAAQFGEHLGRLGIAARDRRGKMLTALVEVRLEAPERLLERYPFQLSGGMCQRVLIAMAIALGPQVLIADEPTTALDVTVQAQVLDLIDSLRRETGMAVVLITHDLGIVARHADRVAVMYAGRMVEQGDVGEVFAAPRHPYTVSLLRSIPHLDAPAENDLIPISGQPPLPGSVPNGCAFEARCYLGRGRGECLGSRPRLQVAAGQSHLSACHFSRSIDAQGSAA